VSDIRGFIQNLSVGRGGSGTIAGLRMAPDGALYTADAFLSACIEGRAFGCHFGTLTTPLGTAATTAITTLRPQAWLRVPDGTLIIPVCAEIVVESTGITTQGEISVATMQVDCGNGTSAAGTSGAICLNSAAPVSSNCTARQLATGDVTAETGLLELKRFSFALSAVNQHFTWPGSDNRLPPVLRGPATFALYIGGNAVQFYAQFQWVEYPEASYS